MRKLLLLSLLSIFAFTSCDIDVNIYNDSLPYSVWTGSVTNNYTNETAEYTIAFDNDRSFSIVKVLYDRLGLVGTMAEIGSNYEIRGNEAIVNIGGRVERLNLHNDYITANLYDEGVDAVLNFTFRKTTSLGISNSQWVNIYDYIDNGYRMREIITLRFTNGGKFEEIYELYREGRLDKPSVVISGNYSTYGNNVILHKRNEDVVLVNIKNELQQVQEDIHGKIYIVNYIRK